LIALIIGVNFAAQWNGTIGAIGLSLGSLAELVVVGCFVQAIERKEGKVAMFQIKGLLKAGKNR
jgi:progressive ankylosis protein